jgi:glyoxylase-like metal-dependent hydrolase (beta-lactamase superfamily II)
MGDMTYTRQLKYINLCASEDFGKRSRAIVKTASGFAMLDIAAHILGMQQIIHPTLIWDHETVILVDSGFPGLVPQFREAMEKAGVPFEKLNTVILTHHDIDHIGSLGEIRRKLPHPITVLAYEEEKPYIEGVKTPLKVAQLEANLSALPQGMQTTYQKLKAAFETSRTTVDKTLIDGDELPYCGGITVIHTPGHTLGHICLYLQKSKTLIAGDALEVEGGKLVMAPPSTNYDMVMCKQSLKKLTQYDIQAVICYHGGLYQSNPGQTIAALAKQEDGNI